MLLTLITLFKISLVKLKNAVRSLYINSINSFIINIIRLKTSKNNMFKDITCQNLIRFKKILELNI
jgi:hypothetical protein